MMRIGRLLLGVLFLGLLTSCIQEETKHQIDDKTDVVNIHGMVKNREKLDEFIANKSDKQRIVQYTIEGDPVFTALTHKGNKVEFTYDNTEDTFGSPQVVSYSCAELTKEETDKDILYTLTGCDGPNSEIDVLMIPFDVEKQDLFEFALKYGIGQKNEISTIDHKLVKDLQNGEVAEVNDFQLTPQERQTIYRSMVLANYLEEKKLSEGCNQKPFVSYDMTVKINNGIRHYQWSECDTTADGETMTGLVQDIIHVVEAKDQYKQLPAVKGYYH